MALVAKANGPDLRSGPSGLAIALENKVGGCEVGNVHATQHHGIAAAKIDRGAAIDHGRAGENILQAGEIVGRVAQIKPVFGATGYEAKDIVAVVASGEDERVIAGATLDVVVAVAADDRVVALA